MRFGLEMPESIGLEEAALNSVNKLVLILADPGSLIGRLINGLILAIVVATLARLVYMRFRLFRERRSIEKVAKVAESISPIQAGQQQGSGEKESNGVGDAAREDAALEIIADKLCEAVSDKSMIARRVNALVRIRYVSGAAVEALSAGDADEAQVSLAMPRFAASAPILLGLMGTLWGLSQAITEIQPLVSQIKDFRELPELLNAMVLTLSGMKTAFATSIAGLLAALVLSFSVTRVTRVYEVVLTRLDRVTALDLMPLLSVPEHNRALAAFSSSVSESAQRLEGSSVSLQTLTASLVDAATSTSVGMTSMLQFAQAFQGGTEKLNDFQTHFQERQAARDQELSETVDSAKTLFADNLQFWREARAEQQQDRAKMSSVVDKMEEVNAATTSLVSERQAQEQKDRDAFQLTLTEVANSVAAALAQFREMADEKPEAFAEALRVARDDSKTTLVDFFDHVEDAFVGKIEQISQASDRLLQQQQESWRAAEQQRNEARASSAALEAEQRKSIAELRELHPRICGMHEEIRDSLVSIGRNAAAVSSSRPPALFGASAAAPVDGRGVPHRDNSAAPETVPGILRSRFDTGSTSESERFPASVSGDTPTDTEGQEPRSTWKRLLGRR
jgi:hypothetical protein